MATWRAIKRWEYFEQDEEGSDETDAKKGKSADGRLELELDEKKKRALESYYRRRFWNAMLRYNRLRIYLTQYNDKSKEGDNEELRLRTAKWDMDAVSSLTHYISKRAVIGEYMVISLAEEDIDSSAEDVNFICVGQPAQPLETKTHNHIKDKCKETTELEQTDETEQQRLETYRDLVIYAVYSYLSTVLYRYFLPFLTEKDIDRIFNEVYMFINSMKAEKQSPFSLNYKTDAAHMPAVDGEKVKKINRMSAYLCWEQEYSKISDRTDGGTDRNQSGKPRPVNATFAILCIRIRSSNGAVLFTDRPIFTLIC